MYLCSWLGLRLHFYLYQGNLGLLAGIINLTSGLFVLVGLTMVELFSLTDIRFNHNIDLITLAAHVEINKAIRNKTCYWFPWECDPRTHIPKAICQ